jgi:hypothetical protein
MNKKKDINVYQERVFVYLMINDPQPIKNGRVVALNHKDENNSQRYEEAIEAMEKRGEIIKTKEGIRINPNTIHYEKFRSDMDSFPLIQKAMKDNPEIIFRFISRKKRSTTGIWKDLLALGEYSKRSGISEKFLEDLKKL